MKKGFVRASNVKIRAHDAAILSKFKQLRELSLYNCGASLNAFQKCKPLRSVEWVSIRGGNLVGDTEGIVARVFPNVEYLDLSYTTIDETILPHLAQLPELTLLNLEGCRVSEAALRALSSSKSLQCVWVDSKAVSPEFFVEWRKTQKRIELLREREPPTPTYFPEPTIGGEYTVLKVNY